MKRAAVFAHYDRDNIIDDYVIYYLRALKHFCEKIVFVSCCDLPLEETDKLGGIADFVIAKKHDEYDFGSYKRGLFYLKEHGLLDGIESLIFANDSCYGPLFPIDKMFEEMETGAADFWAVTKNKFGMRKKGNSYIVCKRPHLQSYFLVFRNNVFNDECFSEFLRNIKPEAEKNDIVIKYEIGLSELLENKGYTSDFYIKDFYNFSNATILKWRQLITKSKSPFIKCSILRRVYNSITVVDDWEDVIRKNTLYPPDLISKNLERTIVVKSKKTNLPLWAKRIIFDIMSYMPNSLRRICSIIIGRLLKMSTF